MSYIWISTYLAEIGCKLLHIDNKKEHKITEPDTQESEYKCMVVRTLMWLSGPSCNDCVVTGMFGGVIVPCCVSLIVTKDIFIGHEWFAVIVVTVN